MTTDRASGVLLHVTSLSGPFGIGDLGPSAYRFVDFLVESGQKLWQMLPLTPLGEGNSPYSSDSAFAGNTLLISPEQLLSEELIATNDLENYRAFSNGPVDFPAVRRSKQELLHKCHRRFAEAGSSALREEFAAFCASSERWLKDYALFRAIKTATQGLPWIEWREGLAQREPNAIAAKSAELQDQIDAEKFYQFLFFKQWFAVKRYANDRGVRIVGDLPIFVAHDSADVWTTRELFKLDNAGRPTVVAGVPPDYFSETGQLWGNPLYDWQQMRAQKFTWWVNRMGLKLSTFDIVRIDHFRGFVACWEVAANETTAEHGRWVEVPGRELFAVLKSELGRLPVIAEDLGFITPEVDQLRDELGFPGMRVLQFAFDSDDRNLHLPQNYSPNSVAYTATHDSNTTVGWFNSLAREERERCLRYLKSDGREINWDFIQAVSESAADTVIVQLQDLLGLGSEARMNVPSVAEGNWTWRASETALTPELAARLKENTQRTGRI